MLNLRRNQDTDTRSDKRHSSSSSKASASNRFLKRKPDHKKIIEGMESKKKKQTHNHDYFNTQTTRPVKKDQANASTLKSDLSKYMAQKLELTNIGKQSAEGNTKSLETARSDGFLNMAQKYRDLVTNDVCRQLDSSSNTSETGHHFASVQSDFYTPPYNSSEVNGVYTNKYGSKKSKTQKFIQQQLQSQQFRSEINRNDDMDELNQEKQTQKTKDYKRVQAQYESLTKKNKWMLEQIAAFKEKEQILKKQHEHLSEILKEKDRVIDRLTRQKQLLTDKLKSMPESKLKEIIETLKIELRNEQQRILYLKEENTFLQTELLARNEEMTQVYKSYKQLEKCYKEYQLKAIEKIETMKTEIEREKGKLKDEIMEIDSYGQIQKWKQKVVSQQDQLKYLRIQNQCLLMTKDELQKVGLENRKLKDERDYFKKKVLENAKRTKQLLHQTSLSNSSVLLELSECSIQK